ncbi:MAG TPA: transcription antitermination factor NusB [Candidatus Luteococcus avicola]|uniref:Transcription antitermination protein NusB n=1 Tax=Luteococcus sanguinis TaxID=174038 RepID=A0ABW1X315_9ACTN|nr:transcription antitermination factor NusB [Candidatus Luteococcus avicola]
MSSHDPELVGEPVPGRPDLLKITPEPIPVVPNPHHTTRTKARMRAMDLLFESELRGRDVLETLDERIAANEPPVRLYTRDIVRGVEAFRDEIDERISEAASEEWPLERMPRVDRNLARIAVYELDHTETPSQVIIAECVQLAEEFSTDDSAPFLNGLLAKVARTRASE